MGQTRQKKQTAATMSSKPLHPLDREVSDVIDEILSMHKPLSSIVELESKSLQRETILRAMDFILMDAKSRDLLESALGILDAAMNSTSAYNRCTLRKVISTPSKRFAFVVQGSVSEYVCFWNFCSCRNYFERVKLSGKKAMVRVNVNIDLYSIITIIHILIEIV